MIAPVAIAAVAVKVDYLDCEAGRQSCKAWKSNLIRGAKGGVKGVARVALRDGDGVLVAVGCNALVVLDFELTVDQAELGNDSADVEAKKIGVLLVVFPEVVVDHVAQLARQRKELECHFGVAASWYWYCRVRGHVRGLCVIDEIR